MKSPMRWGSMFAALVAGSAGVVAAGEGAESEIAGQESAELADVAK